MPSIDWLGEVNPEAYTADGFDAAYMGFEVKNCVAVYSRTKCIAILVAQGLSEEDAEEWFEFNVVGSYVGEFTPLYIDDAD